MRDTCYVITGPTASGKSSLALQIAERLGCEIVCMDSMQIYTGMDIGTAKPTREERTRIPHHMLDVVSPMENYSVSMYQSAAEACCAQILSRGKTPLFVGGTGFYLRALRHPMAMGDTAADPEIRAAMERRAEKEGGREALYQELSRVDPPTAARLHVNDVRRVIRALEIYAVTGIPMSAQRQIEGEARYAYRVMTLDMDRHTLYTRIDARVDQMMQDGLAQEVQGLLAAGVDPACQAMQGIGYKEMVPCVRGESTPAEARDLICLHTRHYAKRQLTWMRREENVLWTDALSEGLLTAALQYFAGASSERG
ncbi:MAG: tRNA (adenosine(37)-N6)-dimethylallyltransferase MiaA [Clostridia bacterium]|nr:tRNA (adenosine(37)-N6)-dimethylallyltransferase MiaA [Clostridia bacterium]